MVDDLHSFTTRVSYVYNDGGKLKSTSAEFLNSPNVNAENLFGFDVRGGGLFTGGVFLFLKESSYFFGNDELFEFSFETTQKSSCISYTTIANYFLSIRFCRDAFFNEISLTNGTRVADYVDGDNNRYVCRKIYNRVWMCENLMTQSYHDGTPIPTNKVRAYDDDFTNAWTETILTTQNLFGVIS